MPLPARNDYSQLQVYFTPKEWTEMSDYEKLRLKNIKENYEMMLEVGLQVQPPEFMRPRRSRKRPVREESDSDDEEWTPSSGTKRKKASSRGSFRTPFKAPHKSSTKPCYKKKQPSNKPHTVTSGLVYDDDGNPLSDDEHTGGERIIDLLEWKDCEEPIQSACDEQSCDQKSRDKHLVSDDHETASRDKTCEQTEPAETSEAAQVPRHSCPMKVGGKAKSVTGKRKAVIEQRASANRSRYPRRAVTRKCYKEDDVPDDDHYIYCEDCHEVFEGECSKHPLTFIPDAPAPKGCEDRAKKTLPGGLQIKQSRIPGAGLGVHTTRVIPKGYRFGPYDGDIVDMETGYDSGYAWEICVQGKSNHYVDSKSEKTGNWMRYINCARNESEQNLVAFQYHGQIYYRSFKPIYPGSELLVYYGEQYAKELGIHLQLNKLKFDTESGLYRCEVCDKLYSVPIILARHLKFHHGYIGVAPTRETPHEEVMQFIIGGKHVNDITRANQTQLMNSKKCKRSCPEAQIVKHEVLKKEETNNCISSHKDRIENLMSKAVRCKGCKKEFSDEMEFAKHDCVTNNRKARVCDKCGKVCNTFHHHAAHKRIHTCKAPFVCDTCGKACNRDADLTKHKRVHTGEKRYRPICDTCGKAFNHEANLTIHKRIHTGERPFVCDTCGEAFSHNHVLTSHKRIHTGERPYVCDTCGKAFSLECNLKAHKLIHTGERPFVCDTCGKAFNMVHHLTSHKRIHTGEKPFVCDTCGKAFNQDAHLTTHKRIHTGEKPYVCETCGKAFNREFNLTGHKRIHTGERPYVCDTCGKAFNDGPNLTKHKRIHTGEKPYVCTICGKGFTRSSYLQSHECRVDSANSAGSSESGTVHCKYANQPSKTEMQLTNTSDRMCSIVIDKEV